MSCSEMSRNECGVALRNGTCPGPAGAACAREADMFFQHGSNLMTVQWGVLWLTWS